MNIPQKHEPSVHHISVGLLSASAVGIAGCAIQLYRQSGGALSAVVLVLCAVVAALSASVITLIRSQKAARKQIAEECGKLRDALAHNNKELESFAYSISHDLRAPLRIMRGFSQILEEDHGPQLDEDAQGCIHRISEAAGRMDALIRDLLDYSRLTREEIELVPVDLDGVYAEVIADLDHTIRETGAVIRKQNPLPRVLGHRRMIRQSLENLLANAMKFVPPGAHPTVEVRSVPKGELLRVEVVDHGIGVPQEYQDRIFRVFERLHGVETYPGTGIGLAIVAKAMERLGGNCGVSSNTGEGSTFWFEIKSISGNNSESRHAVERRTT